AVEIELIPAQPDDVAVAAREQYVVADRAAQCRHADVERLPRGRRRRFPPELVDQAVEGNRLAGVQQEERQHGPFLRTPDMDPAAFVPDLERSENAELHAGSIVTGR